MLFADISFTTEGVIAITALLAALAAAVKKMFDLLMAAKDAQIALAMKNGELDAKNAELREHEAMEKTLQEMADEALASAIQSDNKRRKREGKEPLSVPTAVVPEGNSPPTDKQRLDAWIQTRRNAMVALKEQAGQEPRHEPGSIAEAVRKANPISEVPAVVPVHTPAGRPIAAVLETIKDDAESIADKANLVAKVIAAKGAKGGTDKPATPAVHPAEDKYP